MRSSLVFVRCKRVVWVVVVVKVTDGCKVDVVVDSVVEVVVSVVEEVGDVVEDVVDVTVEATHRPSRHTVPWPHSSMDTASCRKTHAAFAVPGLSHSPQVTTWVTLAPEQYGGSSSEGLQSAFE